MYLFLFLAGVVSTLAGSGVCSSTTNGMGTEATFNNPVSVAVDARGTVYVTESSSSQIRVIMAGVVSTLQLSILMTLPYGLTLDSSNNLYVSDSTANTISVFVPQSSVSQISYTSSRSCVQTPSGETHNLLSFFESNYDYDNDCDCV